VLYAGLMINGDSVKVLEFNGRFGDPEAQPLLIRMKNDIIPVMEALSTKILTHAGLTSDSRSSVCVVMASGGYPGSYVKGKTISGLADVKRMRDVVAYHAGTSQKTETSSLRAAAFSG